MNCGEMKGDTLLFSNALSDDEGVCVSVFFLFIPVSSTQIRTVIAVYSLVLSLFLFFLAVQFKQAKLIYYKIYIRQ